MANYGISREKTRLFYELCVSTMKTVLSFTNISYCIKAPNWFYFNIMFLSRSILFFSMQAALAPVALNNARTLGTPDDLECATRLVTIAVISILLTAPIGALGIQFFGPRLLPRTSWSRKMYTSPHFKTIQLVSSFLRQIAIWTVLSMFHKCRKYLILMKAKK